MFSKPGWDSAYGGAKWAQATQAIKDSFKLKTVHDKVQWIDKVLDLYHNNGHLLNKTHFRSLSMANSAFYASPKGGMMLSPLEFRAKAKCITVYLPFCSSDVKRLVIARKTLFPIVDIPPAPKKTKKPKVLCVG